MLLLRKLREDYDPTDRAAALHQVIAQQARGELLTGLLYVDGAASDLHETLQTSRAPLNSLGRAQLCPGTAALDQLNASLR